MFANPALLLSLLTLTAGLRRAYACSLPNDMTDKLLYLYGGDKPWASDLWVTTDDRVRGGASHSYLSVDSPDHARFWGHLDTSTLGGAGFASQHSLGELHLDLADYEGITVSIRGPDKADGKRYALTLKDKLVPPSPDGGEQSSLSWEAEFVAEKPGVVKLPWREFKPTYRGREPKDAGELNLKDIKRVGLMMRSFFGKQDGDFQLHLLSIAAYKEAPHQDVARSEQHDDEDDDDEEEDLKAGQGRLTSRAAAKTWWKRLLCGLV